MKLYPFKHTVLFQFLDATEGAEGAFSERSRAGLIIPRLQATQKGERWGKVIAVGPEAADILIGDYVLIEPLMWTLNGRIASEKFWKTNADKIMAVTNDLSETTQF